MVRDKKHLSAKGTSNHLGLYLLLSSAFFHFMLFSILLPPWQGHDEPMHLEYIELIRQGYVPSSTMFRTEQWWKHIPENVIQSIEERIVGSMKLFRFWTINEIPVSPEANDFSAIYRGATALRQAPLYYMLNALLLSLFNIQSLLVSLYVVRFVSIMFWLGTIYMIYQMSRAYFGEDNPLVYGAPFAVMILPMPALMAGVANNDALAVFISSAALAFMATALRRGPRKIDVLLLFACTFFALLSKRTTITLLALIPIFCVLSYLSEKGILIFIRSFMISGVVILLLILIILSPLWQLLGISHWADQPERSLFVKSFFSWQHQDTFFHYFYTSFWGCFVWGHHFLPDYIYSTFLIINSMLVMSLLWSGVRISSPLREENLIKCRQLILFVCAIMTQFLLIYIRFFAQVPLWNLAQGRFILGVIGPIMILFTVGLEQLVPPPFRRSVLILCGVSLLLFDLYVQLCHIWPHYYMFYY
ncbi:hypothetical protein ACFL27_06955 [candidate division CSSED10-310 bacterium]|uniref:Glycosyltransferase RgtA/B/C/D-like domain-containing protein n=1 Tax=candidate division CSSED10-310 bacterium TaxID=2855610 RepID=A0ABV6YUS9_UNCC1